MTDNLFDDTPATPSEGGSATFAQEPATEPQTPEQPSEPQEQEPAEPTGDKDPSEPPSEEPQEDKEPAEKFIPEKQFKAALKNVTDRLEKLQQENAQLKATPAPDRDQDPEGYERHVRIETSKELMMETHPDYAEVITHYAEMAKANPALNAMVADAKLPAKLAYDLAKKDMELRELASLKDSDDWKEFQEWKKSKAAAPSSDPKPQGVKPELTVVQKKTSVPNLNRSTDVSRSGGALSDDVDSLFAGAL